MKSESNSPTKTEKEIGFSIQKTYDLYHYLLLLILELADYAQLKIDFGKQKFIQKEEDRNPNTKFIDNKAIQLLRENESLTKYCKNAKMSWVDSSDLVKKLYTKLSSSDFFIKYMAEPSRTFNGDKQLLIDIIVNVLDDCEELYDTLEEQSIYWVDDVEFVLSMMVKTISQLKPNQPKTAELLPLYKNDDDKQFPIRLFRQAVKGYDEYTPLIEKFTKNWELERIAFMDVVILQLAIAESIEFPNIPIKVSIDEYIELSKYFSTPNSAVFINGVLDKILQELVSNGTVVKSGRGLIGSSNNN